MEKFRLHIIIFLVLMTTNFGFAQQFPLTTQYLFNPYALTPSMAGVTGYSEMFLDYRSEWTGIEGHPQTARMNTFGNIYKNQMWLGGEIYLDNTDILSRFKANLSYTYKLLVQNEQFIHFAVWGSYYQNVINYSKAVGVDPNDPIFQDITKITASKFNAGFGLNYNWRRLNVGFSIPTLFTSREEVVNGQGVTFNLKQEFLFHASNVFSLNNNIDLETFAVFRKTTNEPLNFELSVMGIFLQRFWTGLLFRKGGALGVLLGGNLVKGMVFNYSYEIPVGGINTHSGGAHEITIGWRFGMKSKPYFENNTDYYRKNKGNKRTKTGNNKDYPPIYDYQYRKIKR